MKNKIIKVDLNKVELFKREGSQLLFTKEAEDKIVELLKLKELVNEAIEYVKYQILKSGQSIMGVDFKGIVGKKIKVIKREYGERFEIANEEKAKDFIYEMIVKKIKIKEVEDYIKKTGELPAGLIKKERKETLTILKNKNGE